MATVLDAMRHLKWEAKFFTPKANPQEHVKFDEADITHWFEGENAFVPRYEGEFYDEVVEVKLVRWPLKVQLVIEFHKLSGEGGDVHSIVDEIVPHRMDKYPHHAFFDNPPVILKALHDVYVHVNENSGFSLDCVYESRGWDYIVQLSRPTPPPEYRRGKHHRDWDDYSGEGWFHLEPPY